MESRELLVLDLLEEGRQITVTATTSHLSPDECPVTYEIDWGDGGALDTGTVECGVPFSVRHPYATEGAYMLALRVRDRQGMKEPSLVLSVSLSVPLNGH